MKYIIISLILLALLFTACTLSTIRVSHAIEETSRSLASSVESRKNGQQSLSLKQIADADRIWRSNAAFFGTVLRHDSIDEVIGDFAMLQAYAKSEDTDDFYSNCASLLAKLEHIREMEYPFLQNIL